MAFAVGHEEHALAAVAALRCLRAEYSDRNAATHCFQCRDEGGELPVGIPRDVLAEETTSPAVVEDAKQPVDEPALVGVAEAAAGDAVGLAGVSRSDDMNRATPRSSVEGSRVRPDRSRMKPPRLHARDQACGGSGFPLHVSDAAREGFGNSDAEFQPADPGAEAEDVEGSGERNSGGT